MKGISLPIEMIIILSISVIVLLSIALFFSSGFVDNTQRIGDSSAWNQACGIIKARGCNVNEKLSEITLPHYRTSTGKDGTAMDACEAVLVFHTASDCVKSCCYPGYSADDSNTPGTD